MRISDWSSDVCSSDLRGQIVDRHFDQVGPAVLRCIFFQIQCRKHAGRESDEEGDEDRQHRSLERPPDTRHRGIGRIGVLEEGPVDARRSEEHTSELQSLMRISYAVFCLKKKKKKTISTSNPLQKNTKI